MAIVDDDMKEDADYSSLMNSLDSNLSDNAFSLEDVAWADSCLSKGMDSPNGDWSSMKDALLEILISRQGPPTSASIETNGQPTDDEILHFRESVASPEFGGGSDVDEGLIDDDFAEVKSAQSSEDDEHYLVSKLARIKGKRRVDVFRPNYREDIVAVKRLDSGIATYDGATSSENIFKVWDLGISDEQDDFSKQLNKALAEFPPQNQPTNDNPTSWKDSMNMSVESLVDGIGGLSLMQNTK